MVSPFHGKSVKVGRRYSAHNQRTYRREEVEIGGTLLGALSAKFVWYLPYIVGCTLSSE